MLVCLLQSDEGRDNESRYSHIDGAVPTWSRRRPQEGHQTTSQEDQEDPCSGCGGSCSGCGSSAASSGAWARGQRLHGASRASRRHGAREHARYGQHAWARHRAKHGAGRSHGRPHGGSHAGPARHSRRHATSGSGRYIFQNITMLLSLGNCIWVSFMFKRVFYVMNLLVMLSICSVCRVRAST